MATISRKARESCSVMAILSLSLALGVCSLGTAAESGGSQIDENNVRLDQVDQQPGVSSEVAPPKEENPEVFIFPATGDTRYNQSGTNFWNAGDYVEGSRTFTVSTQQMDMVLQIGPNVLSCDTQDEAFMVDGVTIGNFVVSSGDTQVLATFNFAQIDPGPHTLRIETTRTVNPGCGSAGFPNDVSTVDFIQVPVELMSLTVE